MPTEPLTDADRHNLKPGDLVRMVNDDQYQFIVVKAPYFDAMRWLIELREVRDDTGALHHLEGVTHIISKAAAPAPRAAKLAGGMWAYVSREDSAWY
jgi:bifunctional DNA-binding transcriptional regulator/antitoxin component of YhaV-PrlF toxin-antitoxin module